MRFHCGLSKRQKELLKAENFKKYCSVWHKEFAIIPVRTLDGVCVWLEEVEFRVHPFLEDSRTTFDRVAYRLPGSSKDMVDYFEQQGYDVPTQYLKERDNGSNL